MARAAFVTILLGCLSASAHSTFDEVRAGSFARLATAAYCADEALLSWSCGPKCIPGVWDVGICHGDVTKAYVARWEGQCLVSFEGTSNAAALFNDLRFFRKGIEWSTCHNCSVHSGFLITWNSLKDCVILQLLARGCAPGSRIRTTGHSLGAGINSLAMLDLDALGWRVSESYDFGMPRAGDEAFARMFQQTFGQTSWRVTHHRDPIVHLPPRDLIVDWQFRHKEPEAFYDGNVSQGYKVCTDPLDNSCAWKYRLMVDAAFLNDHMYYMDVDIHCKNRTSGPSLLV